MLIYDNKQFNIYMQKLTRNYYKMLHIVLVVQLSPQFHFTDVYTRIGTPHFYDKLKMYVDHPTSLHRYIFHTFVTIYYYLAMVSLVILHTLSDWYH